MYQISSMKNSITEKLKASDKNNPPDIPYAFNQNVKWKKKHLYSIFWRIDDYIYCNKIECVSKMFSIIEYKEVNRSSAKSRGRSYLEYLLYVCRTNSPSTF